MGEKNKKFKKLFAAFPRLKGTENLWFQVFNVNVVEVKRAANWGQTRAILRSISY